METGCCLIYDLSWEGRLGQRQWRWRKLRHPQRKLRAAFCRSGQV